MRRSDGAMQQAINRLAHDIAAPAQIRNSRFASVSAS
jgi:hypothetical protein